MYLAVAATAILCAFNGHANPIDTDNDNVLDDDDDCPNQKGSPLYAGCPYVSVTGTRDDIWDVTCPDGTTVAIWTHCVGFTDWTRWHAVYHDPDTGAWLYTDTTTTTTETAAPPETTDDEELSTKQRYEQAMEFCLNNAPLDAPNCSFFAAGYVFDFCDNQHMAAAEGGLLACGAWAK